MPLSLLLLNRAAYKGFADTIRLLLFRDASQGRQDKEGIFVHYLMFKYYINKLMLTATPY